MEARNTSWREEILFAKHVETLQQFGFTAGVETDTTGEMVFQLPENFLSNTGVGGGGGGGGVGGSLPLLLR